MTTTLDFIKQISAGDNTSAIETLNNLIANHAANALDSKKEELAQNMFNEPTVKEEVEINGGVK
jgi:urate oxidase